MKHKLIIFVAIIIALSVLFSTTALAHSGGTDRNGGHYNHSTGEYHYHHGKSAHQHPDGVCPYDKKLSLGNYWLTILLLAIISITIYLFGFYFNSKCTESQTESAKVIIFVIWAVTSLIIAFFSN